MRQITISCLLDKRSGPAAGALGARAMNYYYGLLDDLTLQYQGNRLVKVTDAVEDPDYAEANDFADGEDKAAEYEYDAMGRLTADHNKGIVLIGYNVLGLPSDIWVNGGHARYTYDADGTLLCRSWGVDEIKPVLPVTGVDWGVTVTDPHIPVFRESSRREWCGDFEYADGAFERMRHSAGWLGADGRHTAEIKDYQGNVRATWTQGNQKTTNPAAVEKGMWYDNVTGYYPYGLPWASMQGQESRLYSGKELERMHALNLYDFHARLYDPQLGRFLSPDPCSTQYEPLSPYLYCAANPILLTDPTGMAFTTSLAKRVDYIRGYAREKLGDENISTDIRDRINEYLGMLNVLEASTQMYDFKICPLENEDGPTAQTVYDEKTDYVIIKVYSRSNQAALPVIVHEGTHCYQFEIGETSLTNGTKTSDKKNNKYSSDLKYFFNNGIYDITDEYDAIKYQNAFGGKENPNSIQCLDFYKKLSSKALNIYDLPQINQYKGTPALTRIIQQQATRFGIVLRFNGVTYKPHRPK